MGSKNGARKNAFKYSCINCGFLTCNKYDYTRHLGTPKHKNALNDTKKNANTTFNCECGKQYKYNSGYYRHKKTCTFIGENEELEQSENVIIKKDEIDYGKIITELKNIIVDQQKQIGELIPRIGNNNIKQKFNINVFLNEQCKDAITINKFIDNLTVSIEDLFLTKNRGITEGITNIITKNMNKLSLYERPLHCTDVKRETVYIKSEGEDGEDSQWEKDNEQDKLKKAIKDATYMQSKNLKLYIDNNPDWMNKENKQIEYMTMARNCMDDIKKDNRDNKVIKKLCNNVYYCGEK